MFGLATKRDLQNDSAGSLSAAEEHYYKALEQKYIATGWCESDELLRERIAAARRSN